MCPMTSAQIAQMNGGYNSMYLQNQQMAAAVGGGHPTYGGSYGGTSMSAGEAAFGGMTNTAASFAPMARAGLGMAGLDPLGVGMGVAASTGMAAYSGGASLLGAGAVGLGAGAAAALPVAGLYAGASYAGGHIMTGMQQQQQLSMMMRSAYGNMPNNYGGTGFTGTDLSQMGRTMRDMSTQQGSMGQMVGFEELGRLAANMGRMGMSQGVRDAKEFRDKFKQMVSTLKTIAEDMGTSLEEAQKMMQGMRSSGVFGMGNQAGAAKAIRGVAVAGGLATSEVTGMMGVGSQISRMIGGRGGSGAVAGMQAISTIGTAQQMGILSEEDIYNVTGLTGAEGRRAMATQQLQTSARFLQSSMGRRIVAAMAGSGGRLDEESVQAFMAGGVGTGETMQMAGRNLSRVGRANFIRNEKRLRGEIMGRFGGLMPAIAMRGWLGQRGIDPDSDRAMIFAQRRLGMGTDEAEQLMKMVKNLPSIMQERRYATENAEMRAATARHREHTGIRGIKHKLREAEAKVSAALEQYGADLTSSISDSIDRLINRATGDMVSFQEKDIMKLYDKGMRGDKRIMQEYFGIGGMAGDMGAYKDAERRFATEYTGRGAFGAVGGALGRVEQMFFGKGRARARQSQEAAVSMTSNLLRGGQGLGLGPIAGTTLLAGQGSADDILRAQAFGGLGGRTAAERLSRFGRFMKGREGEGWGDVRMGWGMADDAGKSRIMGRVLQGAGRLQGEVGVAGALGADTNLMNVPEGIFATAREREEAMGQFLMKGAGVTQRDVFGEPGSQGGLMGTLDKYADKAMGALPWVAGALMPPVGMAMGAFNESIKGTEISNRAALIGKTLDTKEMRDLNARLLSKDSDRRVEAVQENLKKMASLRQMMDAGKLKGADLKQAQSELFVRGTADVASRVATLFEDSGGGEGFDAGLDKLVEEQNASLPPGAPKVTKQQLLATAAAHGGLQQHKVKERVRQAALQASARARKSFDKAGRLYGMVERTEGGDLKLTGLDEKALAAMGEKGQNFLKYMFRATEAERQMSGVSGMEERDQRLMEEAGFSRSDARGELFSMSLEESKAVAGKLRAGGAHGLADYVAQTGKTKDRLHKSRDIQGTVAKMLGGEIDAATRRKAAIAGYGKMEKQGEGSQLITAKGILKSMGLEGGDVSDATMKQMVKTLQASGVMRTAEGDKAKETQELMKEMDRTKELISKDIQEKKLKEDEANNPLMAKMVSSLSMIESSTQETTDAVRASANQISAAVEKSKDGEEK